MQYIDHTQQLRQTPETRRSHHNRTKEWLQTTNRHVTHNQDSKDLEYDLSSQ